MKKGVINWSEVSRMLTGNRGSIRSDYSRKRYAEAVNELRKFVEKWIEKYIS